MKLAFSTNAYLNYSFPEAVRRLAAIGYSGVEIMADVPHAWPAYLLPEQKQAIRDALTNIFNRRYLEDTLERELARASREVYPLCIVMMDIDHFKDVNDTYGHEAGDIVLKMLAQLVTTQSRQGDFVCRFGGEEFVLVMPNISIDIARERANNLHRSITTEIIPFRGQHLTITISMGISWFPAHGEKKEDLLRAADRALYAAKRAGRNRVFVYQEPKSNQEQVDESASYI